jgi:hypothetical protein
MSSAQRDNENLRDALRNLTNGFNIVAKDRTPFSDPSSKKLALFGVTNVLFKIYFKLNTLQLCSKLINVVERPGALNAIDHYLLFPVSDVVTYKFYIGRLKMFEDKYEDARFVSLSPSASTSLSISLWPGVETVSSLLFDTRQSIILKTADRSSPHSFQCR